MLTATQVETVAFVSDGGIICRDCAVREFGEMGVAAIEEGIAEFIPQDVSPLIRYELDTLISEQAYEHANEEVGPCDWRSDPDATTAQELARIAQCEAWQAAYDAYPDEYCDSCGETIS